MQVFGIYAIFLVIWLYQEQNEITHKFILEIMSSHKENTCSDSLFVLISPKKEM